MCLRACYAMYGTEISYGATRLRRDIRDRASDVQYCANTQCYALATRCPVLSYYAMWYCGSVGGSYLTRCVPPPSMRPPELVERHTLPQYRASYTERVGE
eukprot:3361010-Rhodomonas_salina.3